MHEASNAMQVNISVAPRKPARLIAFYLPQFHPISQNDEWWGKGFTEWTNVMKAKPLFKKHYQPNLPADLGFYDLRVPEVREAQAGLARAHGVTAFCYWHYWFGNGQRLLERPFEEVLSSGEPNFPFCLAWANQTWSGIWHGAPDRILVKQEYPGAKDAEAHFRCVLRAFVDSRYIQVDGKPLFVVYRPTELPEPRRFTDDWRRLAVQAGLKGLYFVGVAHRDWDPREAGFDAVVLSEPMATLKNLPPHLTESHERYARRHSLPVVYSYSDVIQHTFRYPEPAFMNHPCVFPNWDNTPRCGARGWIFSGATPDLFRELLHEAFQRAAIHVPEERLVFIKSWNEWAEGNYLEPDCRFGRGYLEAVRAEVIAAQKQAPSPQAAAVPTSVRVSAPVGREPREWMMVITHAIPYPPVTGAEVRMLRLLRHLRALGYGIILLLSTRPGPLVATELKRIADELYYPEDDRPTPGRLPQRIVRGMMANSRLSGLTRHFQGLARRAAVVPDEEMYLLYPEPLRQVCSRPLIYRASNLVRMYQPKAVIADPILMSPCLDAMGPNVLKMIDAHDVTSLKGEKIPLQGSCGERVLTAEDERQCLLCADVVIAMQANEAVVLRNVIPERRVITMGVDFEIHAMHSPEASKEVVIVASDSDVNRRDVTEFIRQAWPLVHAHVPGAVLRVAGRVGQVVTGVSSGVQLLGWIPNLDEIYQRAAVVVNPVMAGTGLRVRTLEALSRGKCLVAWPHGVEGLPLSEEAEWVECRSWREFGEAVVRLLEDPRARTAMEMGAHRLAQEYLTASAIYREFDAILEKGMTKRVVSPGRDRCRKGEEHETVN